MLKPTLVQGNKLHLVMCKGGVVIEVLLSQLETKKIVDELKNETS